MKYTPHNYQQHATTFIETHPQAAIFLGMGLGKTIITLTALEHLIYNTFQTRKALIIAPLRVARDTWPAEIKKWDHLQNLTYTIAVGDKKNTRARHQHQRGHHHHQPRKHPLARQPPRKQLGLRHRHHRRTQLIQITTITKIQSTEKSSKPHHQNHRPDRHPSPQQPRRHLGPIPPHRRRTKTRKIHHPLPKQLLHAR